MDNLYIRHTFECLSPHVTSKVVDVILVNLLLINSPANFRCGEQMFSQHGVVFVHWL